jgi:Glycosyl transferase 4-like domain
VRVVLFAYHFPPAQASQGVRWQQLSAESVKHGLEWEILTATLSDNRIDAGDITYLTEAWSTAPGVTVHPTEVGVRHSVRRFRKTAQGNMVPVSKLLNRIAHLTDFIWVPDRSREWMAGAIRKARALHQERPFDLVVSSGIPVSAHVAARDAARALGVPWVSDWGDPWGLNPVLDALRSKLVRPYDRWLERSLVRDADGVSVTTDALAQTYRELRGQANPALVMTLRMGYDSGEFSQAQASLGNAVQELGDPNGRIRLVHTGLYYPGRRDPSGLIEALSTRPDLAARLEVVSVGPGDNEEFKRLAQEKGVSESFRWLDSRPRIEAIAMQCAADVLLSFGFDSPYQIPGKLSEYAACDRPVLHIRGSQHDPSLEVMKYLRRSVISNHEPGNIATALEHIVKSEWNETIAPEPATSLSWPALAKQLVGFLEKIKKNERALN